MKSINLIELGYLSTLEIIGEGAIDLLQGQITSDMEKVSDNQSCLGALCNIKGRVESSFLVIKKPSVENAFLLIGNKEVMKATEEILKKYSNFEFRKEDIAPGTEDWYSGGKQLLFDTASLTIGNKKPLYVDINDKDKMSTFKQTLENGYIHISGYFYSSKQNIFMAPYYIYINRLG